MKSQNSNLKTQILEFYMEKNLSEDLVEKTIPLVKERMKKLSDYFPLCEFYFTRPENYEISLKENTELLKEIITALESVSDWKADRIGQQMVELAQKEAVPNSKFFMILRVAISGKKITPPLNESMEILGKEESISRIKSAFL